MWLPVDGSSPPEHRQSDATCPRSALNLIVVTSDHLGSVADIARHLYGLEAAEFIAARNEAVRQLRADGCRELAAQVGSLRRPTVLAAELNRALRAAPAEVEALVKAAGELREAQRQALNGDQADLAGLRRHHRQVATNMAVGANRDRARVRAVLEAASLDPLLHPDLRAATFAAEPQPQTGFDLLDPAGDDAWAASTGTPATVSSLADARARRRHRQSSSEDGGTPAATDDDQQPGPPSNPDPASVARATRALELARRRQAAANDTATNAAERVAAAERRLAAARGNLAEAEVRLEAANDAEAQARAELSALTPPPT